MIAHTEHLAGAKVGGALTCAVLFKDAVNAVADQIPEQEVGGVEGVAEQDVSGLDGIKDLAQQGLFVVALAEAGCDRGIAQCPAGWCQKFCV
jgi:hypothetical protein